MEPIIIIVILAVIVFGFILPISAFMRSGEAWRRADEANQKTAALKDRINELENKLLKLQNRQPESNASAPETVTPLPISISSSPTEQLLKVVKPSVASPAPPPLPEIPFMEPAFEVAASANPVVPPSVAPSAGVPPPLGMEPGGPKFPSKPDFNWEQFLGAKLFAWVAGLALFLGVAFFLKWSFDHGYVTPPLRVAMGLVTGLGLLVGGLKLHRERHAALVQSLTSAGVLILYADIFASCSFYHFLGNAAAFALMALVTTVAFLLAVRLNGPVVAALGLLGGFLTPPLLSTGVDHPWGLFGYIALLDIGLIAVALHQRWNYFVILSAVATVIMQIGWVNKFFAVEKMSVAVTVFLGFVALYLAAIVAAHRRKQADAAVSSAGILMPLAALAFAFHLLARPYDSIAAQPGLLFGFIFAADAAWLALAGLRREWRVLHIFAGSLLFILLTYWTSEFLTDPLLNAALVIYLVFGILHTVYPVVVERLWPSGKAPWWGHLFTVLALVLTMFPMFKLYQLSLLIWPVILILDLLAIVVAMLTASILIILSVLGLTAIATAVWICKLSAEATGLPETLLIIGGFAAVFFGVGTVVFKKFEHLFASVPVAGTGESSECPQLSFGQLSPAQIRALIPALSALLPFFLLAMILARLKVTDPSSVFGLAALMLALLLGVIRFYAADWVGVAGLLGLGLVEAMWQFNRFHPDAAGVTLAWYLGFYAGLAAFPFVFLKQMRDRLAPWIMAALAGPVQFYLLYRVFIVAYPHTQMGLIPAAFALPSLLSLGLVLRSMPTEAAQRNHVLAFFGGVTLFFITLIFPIQFEKQWITIGWAMEGTALLWLLHRVPHNGLKYVGTSLLIIAFIRLSLNPAVLSYHARSDTLIWNWYLYAYGIVTLCLFAGARLLAPPRHLVKEINAPPILAAMGTVLAFLLLNIEIADYYSTGTTITFQFSGNLGQDMTYSLAWAVFAFVLLVAGFKGRIPGWRYAGLGLLVVTLLKLFLHDLWRLGGLYRIGSLIGLALVLIPVSFIYQRFFANPAVKKNEAEIKPPAPPLT